MHGEISYNPGKSFKKGAVWRVGDGRKIDIWSHSWLPDVGQSKVILPRIGAGAEKVCDLFYPNSKIWDPGLIQHILYPWEAEKILKIHVNEIVQRIRWFGQYLRMVTIWLSLLTDFLLQR